MRLDIINPETLELESVITLFESVQWVTCYNTPDGKFQINCGMQYFGIVKEDMYVKNSEDSEHIGVIKKIQTLKSNVKESLQITGIMLEKDVLSRRIVKGIYTYMDIMPTFVIHNLLYRAMIDPIETNRKMANIGEIFIPKDDEIEGMSVMNYASRYPNLSDEIFSLIQNANIGFKAKLNDAEKKIDLHFYVGEDHTEGSDNPIVLSRDYGTALEVDYAKDSSQNITNLIALGEDNTYVEVQRGNPNGEQRIEKVIDISGEVPWPTYVVEKPEEEGGQYFRYKKVTPDGFVTNQDIWEKYNVDRIETTETRYQKITYTEKETMSVEKAIENYPSLAASAILDKKAGLLLGGEVSTKGVIDAVKKSASKTGSSSKVLGYSIGAAPEASSNASSYSLRNFALKAKAGKSPAKTTSKAVKSKVNSGKASLSAKTSAKKLTANVQGDTITLDVEKTGLVEVEVTVVTYEDRDFVEYVYSDPGMPPSESSKIIEGSVSSGNVMYYEHFANTKVDISKYKEALTKAANTYLNSFITSESINVSLYPLSNQRFRHEYNLGDILTAKDNEIGFATDLRVTSATEVWDSKGYSLSITLGDNVPSLTNRIKFLSKGGN